MQSCTLGHEYGISLYLKIMDGNHYHSRNFPYICMSVLARLYLIQKTIPHYTALLGGSSKEDFLIPFDGSLISLFQLA